jgi:alkaline phosphatase D
MKYISLLLIIASLWSCSQVETSTEEKDRAEVSTEADSLVIAFGSCNKEDQPQPIWDDILNQNPDVWIWLGDNIYGDSKNPMILREKYDMQSANPAYQKLKERAKIIGTWDDHDYGVNDGGKGNPIREQSQAEFLRFFEVDSSDALWSQEGVYSAHDFEAGKKIVKVILLDSRYHRDTLARVEGVYQKNDSGTVLGETQWNWLAEQLNNSEADINIIGNGIQFVSSEHRFEKWANFPKEQQRLYDLIASSGARGVVLISGDRHVAEVSERTVDGLDYPLRDITASGMTHSYEQAGGEPNQYRISPLVGQKNFATFVVREAGDATELKITLHGLDGEVFYSDAWTY